MTDPTTTLATIVTERPGAARVLERHRLDYCCGGAETLADACEVAGVDLDVVVAALADHPVEDPPDWAGFDVVALTHHIESTHHRYLHEELPRLVALAAKVASVHRSRHPELVQVHHLVDELFAELEPHLLKEERILFPKIREASAGLDAPIHQMVLEHDQAGELLAQLRATTADYAVPADGCASYHALYQGLAEVEADTHLHVHKENNLLFPQALAL